MKTEISGAGAARFGLMLTAARNGDLVVAAEMLLSITETDLDGIKRRLAEFGIDPKDLVATVLPGTVI